MNEKLLEVLIRRDDPSYTKTDNSINFVMPISTLAKLHRATSEGTNLEELEVDLRMSARQLALLRDESWQDRILVGYIESSERAVHHVNRMMRFEEERLAITRKMEERRVEQEQLEDRVSYLTKSSLFQWQSFLSHLSILDDEVTAREMLEKLREWLSDHNKTSTAYGHNVEEYRIKLTTAVDDLVQCVKRISGTPENPGILQSYISELRQLVRAYFKLHDLLELDYKSTVLNNT